MSAGVVDRGNEVGGVYGVDESSGTKNCCTQPAVGSPNADTGGHCPVELGSLAVGDLDEGEICFIIDRRYDDMYLDGLWI